MVQKITIPIVGIASLAAYEMIRLYLFSKLSTIAQPNQSNDQTENTDGTSEANVLGMLLNFLLNSLTYVLMNSAQIGTVALCFFMWHTMMKMYGRQGSEALSEKMKAQTPIPFNSQNINLWLQDFEKKWATTEIDNDSYKLQRLITSLDPDSRTIIKKRAADKKIKTYNDAVNYLHCLHGGQKQDKIDNMALFTQRVQKPTETIGQFYFDLVRLANKAFPRANSEQIDDHLVPRFIDGIENMIIRVQLKSKINEKPETKCLKLLESAVDLEDSVKDGRPQKAITFNLNNINTERQEQDESDQSDSSVVDVNVCNVGERYRTLRNHDNGKRRQPAHCYACGKNGHFIYQCPDEQAYANYMHERQKYYAEKRKQAQEAIQQHKAPHHAQLTTPNQPIQINNDLQQHTTANKMNTWNNDSCTPKHTGMANNYPEKPSSAGGYNQTGNQHNNSNMTNNRFRHFNESNGTLNVSESKQTQSGVRME